MEISPEWILATLVGLGGVIATLAGIIFKLMTGRLSAQDTIIRSQGDTIDKVQDDIDRLSQGCGVAECLWKGR